MTMIFIIDADAAVRACEVIALQAAAYLFRDDAYASFAAALDCGGLVMTYCAGSSRMKATESL